MEVHAVETANILNNATDRSLIILDEIGRGTSTYDGLAIAWAVVEHLHRSPERGPRALFATHYQELTQLEKHLSRLRNFSVAVKEWNDDIVFVRRVVPGAAGAATEKNLRRPRRRRPAQPALTSPAGFAGSRKKIRNTTITIVAPIAGVIQMPCQS